MCESLALPHCAEVDESDNTCERCNTGWAADSNGNCTLDCSLADPNCVECLAIDNQLMCTKCPERSYLSHNFECLIDSCIDVQTDYCGKAYCGECADGYGVNNEGMCLPCTGLDNCLSCTFNCEDVPDTCTKCVPWMIFDQGCGTCLYEPIQHCADEIASETCEQCEDGYFFDEDLRACRYCDIQKCDVCRM